MRDRRDLSQSLDPADAFHTPPRNRAERLVLEDREREREESVRKSRQYGHPGLSGWRSAS
jgi:hypothetical protein